MLYGLKHIVKYVKIMLSLCLHRFDILSTCRLVFTRRTDRVEVGSGSAFVGATRAIDIVSDTIFGVSNTCAYLGTLRIETTNV